MKNNFYYSFPAIMGKQAGRDFFVIMCPLSILSKLFIFNEEELPPEHRAQRILNKTRIPEMATYIVNNPKDYVFSSVTASV
ncbi:DNA sulfur modification protein DndB, partial [Clostridium cadaveris]